MRYLRPRPLVVLVLALVAVAMSGFAPPAGAAVRATGSTVHYSAGWNLVAAPTGTVLDQAVGSLFSYGPGSSSYFQVGRGDLVGGRSVWAYFAKDVDVALGSTVSEYSRTIIPTNQWVMIGNPSTTRTLGLSGTDMAFGYDTARGYAPVSELKPGQGAWAYSSSGADVGVGNLPTGAVSEKIRGLQVDLLNNPADVSNFAGIPGATDELLKSRQFASVQSTMDDTRAAFQDGLRLANSAAVPGLSAVQHDAAVGVRENLAKAQAAEQGGDLAGADNSVSEARRQAQASEDDAATIAKKQIRERSTAPAFLALQPAPGTPTAANLAAYGALCIATVPALALALPPTPDFVAVVLATLNGTPLPAAVAAPAR